MASRAREEAIHNLDRGDIFGTRQRLQQAKEEMMAAGVCYDYIASDLAEVDDLLKDLETGNQGVMRKKATYQSYQKRRNRP